MDLKPAVSSAEEQLDMHTQSSTPPPTVHFKDDQPAATDSKPRTQSQIASQSTTSSTALQQASVSHTKRKSSGERFDTFHAFPDLPIELRLAIWKLALPAPTLLYVTAYVDSFPDDSPFPFWFETPYCGPNYLKKGRSTTLLETCHESREIYITEFPSALPVLHTDNWDAHMYAWDTGKRDWTSETYWLKCVFRFGPKDVIHFDNPYELFWEKDFWDALQEEDWVKGIEKLEIDSKDIIDFKVRDWSDILEDFTGLKRVQVQEQESKHWPDSVTEKVWMHEWKKIKGSLMEKGVEGLHVPEMVWLGMEVEEASKKKEARDEEAED